MIFKAQKIGKFNHLPWYGRDGGGEVWVNKIPMAQKSKNRARRITVKDPVGAEAALQVLGEDHDG